MCSYLQIIVLLTISLHGINGYKNVCKNYADYYLVLLGLDSTCYESKDIFANTREIIENHKKPYEIYPVVTDDGYILTLFRLPRKYPKGVVMLQHPALTDAIIWVGQGNQSLAFLLWEAGYDVWLASDRGTHYSENHLTLSPKNLKFWDYSYHEMGIYDIPAIVKVIKLVTKVPKIIFIGHSMATSSSLAFASLQPEVARSGIKVFIEISPICYFKHVQTPAKYLAVIFPLFKKLMKGFNIGYIMKYRKSLISNLLAFTVFIPFKRILVLGVSILAGWTPNEFDPELINYGVSQNTRGMSLKTWDHYAQQFNSGGNYQMYDYGFRKNMLLYNQSTPPEYPVGNINVPVYIIYSTSDSASSAKDAEILYNKLSNEAKIYGKLKITGLNHLDFHYGKHRKQKVYDPILQLLNRII